MHIQCSTSDILRLSVRAYRIRAVGKKDKLFVYFYDLRLSMYLLSNQFPLFDRKWIFSRKICYILFPFALLLHLFKCGNSKFVKRLKSFFRKPINSLFYFSIVKYKGKQTFLINSIDLWENIKTNRKLSFNLTHEKYECERMCLHTVQNWIGS